MNFFINESMGIGNSGVEHAQFYRAKRFDQAELPYKFVFTSLVEELHEAMDKWHLKEHQVINMWEYFVLGEDYAKVGVKRRVKPTKTITTDATNTQRLIISTTSSGLRIIKHMVKYPNPKKAGTLLVSANKVEIFNLAQNTKKVTYQIIDDENLGSVIRNIHLFNQPEAQHLFFQNEVQLRRYFFQRLRQAFPTNNNFIIDRGEENEVALLDSIKDNYKVIDVVHADHLGNRNDPKNPLWNNYYEYVLTHLDQVDRLVVSTKQQRADVLLDFPELDDKVVAIPVGGVSDQKKPINPQKKLNKLRLVTMSRLAEEKHIEIIVQAVAQLVASGRKVSLDIYGAGGQKEPLEKLIKESHAEEYIKLKGLTHHAEKVYPQYDAFTSASFSEGFGLTYIEALNAGLPVVTFNARFGATELIQDGYNGFSQSFKRDDEKYNVEQFKAGIVKLLETDYAKMQTNVLKSVEPYRDSNIAKQWRTLINEL